MAVSKTRTPIREQEPKIRAKNFDEVCLGYSLEEGKIEANRCLNCKTKPCVQGCPVGIDIPAFIAEIKNGNMDEASNILSRYTSLPAVCGRVCPQENQCEGLCTVGRIKDSQPVAIGKLERLVADWKLANKKTNVTFDKALKNYKGRVAVVGSGPSALTVAGDLVKLGYYVKIFEALHTAGGVLIYGIPEFRLPKEIVKKEIENLLSLGVEIECNAVVGQTVTPEELKENFDACYIAVGAGAPKFQGVPGTSLPGVYSASEFLTRINLMKGYLFPEYDTPIKRAKNVVVVGGGNVAMDAARSALRLGAEHVTVVYRRSAAELPARVEEYHHAVEEGINFAWLTNPVEYIANDEGVLGAVRCIKMELGEPDESGRRRPAPVKGSEFTIDADCVIEAIGQGANKVLLSNFPDLELTKYGYIKTQENSCKTNLPWVFAGGDIVTGAATVILAMGAGKLAAKEIDEFLNNKNKK
ncbi:MAG: NADPH-dependent glutamate synthase [Synergistaceae bacterium]|nr:NADPH-dependent glutamate synthase [Synergistaceae bacterium]